MKLKGGEKLQRVLKTMLAATGKANQLRVGYLEGGRYPDGQPVALIAAIQNFGAPGAGIPARPFFTNMVAEESKTWAGKMGALLKDTNWDGELSFTILGNDIKGKLEDSIRHTVSPPLSPVTVMLRGMKSKMGPDAKVGGAMVGEAARRVAQGKTNYGASTQPLIDTDRLLEGVGVEVE